MTTPLPNYMNRRPRPRLDRALLVGAKIAAAVAGGILAGLVVVVLGVTA